MRPFPALATLALVLWCAAPAAMAAGEVYKWTDESGVVQYTDAPPEGRPFNVVKTATSKRSAAVQAESQPIDPATGEPIPPAPAAPAPVGSAEANCATARTNVDNLTRYTDVNMDRNGDGTPEKLTPDERAAELERSQSLVKLYCKPVEDAAPAQEG